MPAGGPGGIGAAITQTGLNAMTTRDYGTFLGRRGTIAKTTQFGPMATTMRRYGAFTGRIGTIAGGFYYQRLIGDGSPF